MNKHFLPKIIYLNHFPLQVFLMPSKKWKQTHGACWMQQSPMIFTNCSHNPYKKCVPYFRSSIFQNTTKHYHNPFISPPSHPSNPVLRKAPMQCSDRWTYFPKKKEKNHCPLRWKRHQRGSKSSASYTFPPPTSRINNKIISALPQLRRNVFTLKVLLSIYSFPYFF